MTPFTRRWWPLAAVILGSLASVQVGAKPPATQAGPWTRYENLAPVVGADGQQHTATCSGYPGTNPAFSFWAKRGTSKDLVVFFEGGGACWDSLSCTFPIYPGLPPQVPQFFVPAISPTTNPATYSGVFDQSNSANPVKDWSIVYIPYCTGDVHIGSATRTYFNVGHPVLPLPPTFQIQHRGYDNFMVVLDWMKNNIDSPKNVLVTGSSAGGYGASAHFPWVQQTYPNAHAYVIADASQGVSTAAFDTGNPGRMSWNPQLPPWVFGNDQSFAGPELLRIASQAYPRTKVAQFTTNLDGVQIGFYGVQKQFYGPGGNCPNPAIDWNQQMIGTLSSYASELGNFRHYLASGSYHTIMRSPQFYTENSAGIAYSQWVGAMLQNRGGTNGVGGGDWQDAACLDCLAALPCQ